jgi:hypothetical protein
LRKNETWSCRLSWDSTGETPREDKTRREFMEWQIRFAEKRMADVCARLPKVVDRESDQT